MTSSTSSPSQPRQLPHHRLTESNSTQAQTSFLHLCICQRFRAATETHLSLREREREREMGGGGGELRYEISQNAYIKLVLYARKHKTTAVNGVLVGRVSPQKNDVVEITDSVPRLSPVMKVSISI
ncbi:hypothetical protein LWI29_021419 [Acer saccharum]|uniref:Uncharacterized protein n=1 Tax=Acer saccharum TaxID=4024 RepID=A0AA39VR24_ACESA|nr:hypothetical protein LWI29_021419 [Acer saccharum]